MEKTVLESKVDQYYDLKQRIDELTEQSKVLSQEIGGEMKAQQIGEFYTSKDHVATYGSKTTFKYKDEDKIVDYLVKNGKEALVITKVLTTGLNTKLKNEDDPDHKVLVEALNPYYVQNNTYVVSIFTKEDYEKNKEKYGKKAA